MIAVSGPQFAFVDRGRRDENYAEIVSFGEMRVREDGVEVCGKSVERDMLLWAAWGVWEARVVGALKG